MKKAIDLARELEAKAKAKTLKKPKAKDDLRPQPQLSLDLWPDRIRGVPNAILRGSLFTVSTNRQTFKKLTPIASIDGIDIRFTGVRLNQTDLDLWEMMLHLARLQPLGSKVEFTANEMLRALGRSTGLSQHEQLKDDMARLRAGTVEITWTKQNKAFIGGLVEKAYRDDETGRYVVILDEKTHQLYDNGYTHIEWEQRKSLGRNNLAKWLQGFYASHAEPYDYKVETLYRLCGSTTARVTDFKKDLKKALTELQNNGVISSWSIDNDLVNVKRTPSSSQYKHLKNRKK